MIWHILYLLWVAVVLIVHTVLWIGNSPHSGLEAFVGGSVTGILLLTIVSEMLDTPAHREESK